MWHVAALFLAVAAGQSAHVAPDLLSALGGLRPAKAVLRTVRAAAPELFVGLEERVRAWGYPLEAHTVRTEDGYLLGAYRIPRGRRDPAPHASNALGEGEGGVQARARPPVIVQHGMMACCEYWVLGGPDMAPALRLADAGYDVWMTNMRGNHLSNKHETIARRDPRFWMFSWHEMGYFDTPAFIDYILNVTKQEKLFHIGHSMGNNVFYVAMSLRPEYNGKIRLHLSLAPSVFFDGAKSAYTDVAMVNFDYLKGVVEALPTYKLKVRTDSWIAMTYLTCGDKAYFNKMCALLFSWIAGAVDLRNTTQLCLLLSRTGSDTSLLVPTHFSQNIQDGKFRQLDHGASENMRVYGTPEPPDYPLDKVTAPVAIYSSDGDTLVTPKAAEHLKRQLPNVVIHKVLHEKFFNHMDFIFHPRLNEVVTDHMLETMARF